MPHLRPTLVNDIEEEREGKVELREIREMCEPQLDVLKEFHNQLEYDDGITGVHLDPEVVAKGCEDELEPFKLMQVYHHVPWHQVHGEAREGEVGEDQQKHQETQPVKFRLVAMEFAHGEVQDDLLAGTPSLFASRLLLSVLASAPESKQCVPHTLCDMRCLVWPDETRRCHRAPSRGSVAQGRTVRGQVA